jgi:membrane protease YdiL (CAAX protease family)
VSAVTLLFAAVHVPQYFASPAVIVAVLCLSLALTLLRAVTGKLLPCVATHFIFNGIQAVLIIYQAPKPPVAEPVKTAARAALHLFGCG